jgi:hypothetical protein
VSSESTSLCSGVKLGCCVSLSALRVDPEDPDHRLEMGGDEACDCERRLGEVSGVDARVSRRPG